MKRQYRYTDTQKQELFTFVKGEFNTGTPLKKIFKRVKARFPWYAAKSITAFQIYWKYLKEEFLTYGTPNADDAYAKREDLLRRRLLQPPIKLSKKEKALAKTWGKEVAKLKKLKVIVERVGEPVVTAQQKKPHHGYKLVRPLASNPCSEISLSPTSLVGFSQNQACTVMHHQKLEEFIRLITGVANQALNELPVVMVSALKISHKDNAKFEKIKGIIAEAAGCLDKLDDLIKCLERLREVLGLPAQHP